MNFGGHEVVYNYHESSIVILPVPYDETSTWIRGADRGPQAVMEASVNLEFYDIETCSEVHKKGIYTLEPVTEKSSPEALVNSVYEKVCFLLNDGKFPVIIGGNHTVSIGAAYAFSEKYKELSVLQLDAHADLRNEYEGTPFNHACVMARIREKAHIVQVGIRSMSAEEINLADMKVIYPAYKLWYDGSLYKKALDSLRRNVYITIDLDVFDPSVMPSTGTPEPGGLSYYELMHFLRDVARERNVAGFDVVELCPSPSNKVPDFLAAKIIYQLLGYIFA
ncbi:MAG: agmatinase [Bacteroidales bacterium]